MRGHRKPVDRSEHHAVLSRLKLRTEGGRWTLDATGATFHSYRHAHCMATKTAPARIASHLTDAGYAADAPRDTLDSRGLPHHRRVNYRRGDDVVSISLYVSHRDGVEEQRIAELRHFPHGMGRMPSFTTAQLVHAMIAGPLGAM